ncbi:CAAX protease self-immunity [Ruaniaceae bacterium KH17]|nr:CAAX protease self-immunity [Ruaniaceae bacterium KH17]
MPTAVRRPGLRAEVWIVLGLSLGQSAIYSLMRIYVRLTSETALGDQSASINTSLSPRPYVDLTYQVLGILFALVPVALALYLLSEPGRAAIHRIGFDLARPLRDLGAGLGIGALIGIPGLVFYAIGRALGITVAVNPAALNDHWWAIPILILAALKNAVLEEVIAVGYLLERLEEIGWSWPLRTAASAVLRGLYHLYQGIGPFFGNLVMGLVFNEYYRRSKRVMPLVVAHTLIDIVAFVGYWLLPETWRAWL